MAVIVKTTVWAPLIYKGFVVNQVITTRTVNPRGKLIHKPIKVSLIDSTKLFLFILFSYLLGQDKI